jgi:hypothetical protein
MVGYHLLAKVLDLLVMCFSDANFPSSTSARFPFAALVTKVFSALVSSADNPPANTSSENASNAVFFISMLPIFIALRKNGGRIAG